MVKNRRKTLKKRKCKVWKKCENVPCNRTMNRCKPSYCVPGSSRNWSLCNMSNWKGKHYKKYKRTCKKENHCKVSKRTRKTKHTVDALTLHNKMPYIWRFLKPKTRKHMINLAKKDVKDINIPYHIFPENWSKRTLKKMKKKDQNKILRLRKLYKDI